MSPGRIERMPAGRRGRLLDIAAAEFASAGYEEASLNRIIRDCGMSKSSFYYFIPSKSELFDFVVRELIDKVRDDIEILEPEELSAVDFWPRIELFYSQLLRSAEVDESFLTLGRLFYSDAPDGTKGAISGTLAAVQTWVERLLAVGRDCGAVRRDLPEALQYNLVQRTLQVFDEWTVRHYDEFTPAELASLADAQFATVRRLLGP